MLVGVALLVIVFYHQPYLREWIISIIKHYELAKFKGVAFIDAWIIPLVQYVLFVICVTLFTNTIKIRDENSVLKKYEFYGKSYDSLLDQSTIFRNTIERKAKRILFFSYALMILETTAPK